MPSQTDGLEYAQPTASPSGRWALPEQVDAEAAVFGMLEELKKQVESLPGTEADLRITTAPLKHLKQGLHYMMSKERDREYPNSNGDTSLRRSFGHGGRAMHENVIPCDKAGANPGEVYGGIHVGVVCLRKTLQVICLIFSSLDAAAEFVAPAEGERPSRRRRVKTTLVVTPFSPLATERGKSRRMSSLVHLAFTCIIDRSESSVSRGWLNSMSSSPLTRSPEETLLST